MQVQKMEQKKQKILPLHLRQKIGSIIGSVNQRRLALWADDNSFVIRNCPQIQSKLKQSFDMSYKTFIKFIQMVGCKVKKVQVQDQNKGSPQCHKIILPPQTAQTVQKNQLKQLMQYNQNGRSSLHNEPSYQEMSIQVNIRKPEHELINLQYESEFKEFFIKNFKANIDSTNQFIYNAVYKIMASRNANRMSPCQILQLLTELRDRMFDNKKQLEQCIQNFRHKIKSFGNQVAYVESNSKKMGRQQMQAQKNGLTNNFTK